MRKILFFSNNKNKINEISHLLPKSKFNIANLNQLDKILSPEETGTTFKENAKIKSLFGFLKFNIACFADDSGMCIESMGGKPGIRSKEFLSKEKNKEKIFENIINISKLKNNYSAFFETSICFSLDKNKHIFFTGRVRGKISKVIKGVDGFGYDPIFIPNGHNKTFAEMSILEKNKVSHRAIAISKLEKYLISI